MRREYKFNGAYPTKRTIREAYDDADLVRAIQCYKMFFPVVAFTTGSDRQIALGLPANERGALLAGNPRQVIFTPNSDTPYAFLVLDLAIGPIVIEIPPGPIMGAVNDSNQEWVLDYGLPGPDAGKGGRHLLLPPGFEGSVPEGYNVGRAGTNRVTALLRALPVGGDDAAAFELIKSVKIHPLDPATAWKDTEWVDIGTRKADLTPGSIEYDLDYWKQLHAIIEREPVHEEFRLYYGELAALGIAKGTPFKPDARMKRILKRAARLANAQMRVQSFADRTPERIAWKGRRWEWASLRPENGTWDLPGYKDIIAREKWFYQAMVASPAMFRRSAGAGSLYWLGTRDSRGKYLDGGKAYRLEVPLPVPGKLFWSVTVYDPVTRSEIQTKQGKAALRSLHELAGVEGESVKLYFGPRPPKGARDHWIQTRPGRGWFVYFRIYGPEGPAFDGTWKLPDFERA